jgi:hypothetical protein
MKMWKIQCSLVVTIKRQIRKGENRSDRRFED